jgi:MFS family permease
MAESKLPRGMAAFFIVWIGQIVSVLASAMSNFALSIWMYNQTKSATAMGLMTVFFITPFLIMSPFAGVMVDRYNRKLMMMLSDLTAILATAGILVLVYFNRLEFWHLYIASILYGIGNTFQWPAYSAAISTMVPKEHLGRANGLMSLVEAGPGVLAPLLAGALLPIIQLSGILAIDVITFFFAIGALLIVFVPQPEKTVEGEQAQGSILKEAAYGFKYIFARPSLLGLQMVFFFGNLFFGIGFVVFAPMILARTDSNSVIFGATQTFGAIGAIAGGILMSIWGGFKRRVHGVLGGWIYSGLVGMALLGLGPGVALWIWNNTAANIPSLAGYTGPFYWLALWIPVMILAGLSGSLINGSNQAIWQSKVASDLQGRVFSARRLIAWFTQPIAPIIGGLLADYVLEPSMRANGGFTAFFSPLVGTGAGSGMSLLLIFCGLAAALMGAIGYFIPAIRNAEDLLPDHDQLAQAETAPAAS